MPHVEIAVNSDAVVESRSQMNGFAPIKLVEIVEKALVRDIPQILVNDGEIKPMDQSDVTVSHRTLVGAERVPGSTLKVTISYGGECPDRVMATVVKLYIAEAIGHWFHTQGWDQPDKIVVEPEWDY